MQRRSPRWPATMGTPRPFESSNRDARRLDDQSRRIFAGGFAISSCIVQHRQTSGAIDRRKPQHPSRSRGLPVMPRAPAEGLQRRLAVDFYLDLRYLGEINMSELSKPVRNVTPWMPSLLAGDDPSSVRWKQGVDKLARRAFQFRNCMSIVCAIGG